MEKINVASFINGEVIYDPEYKLFWINGKENGIRLLGELKGTGHIQNMLCSNGIESDLVVSAASELHNEVGEFIASAINEKIKQLL